MFPPVIIQASEIQAAIERVHFSDRRPATNVLELVYSEPVKQIVDELVGDALCAETVEGFRHSINLALSRFGEACYLVGRNRSIF